MTDRSIDSGKRRRGRWQLISLLLAFLLPVAIAYTLYVSGWRSAKTQNYGELVVPPRPIGDATLHGLDGQSRRLADFRGKWLFVYFGPASCPAVCMDNLYKMRQVRAAQAKEAPRIERLFLLTKTDALATLAGRLTDHAGLHVLSADPATIASLAQRFALAGRSPLDSAERIFVVDPLGNLMMSYPANADPNRMRKDMARLLRVSQVG